MKRLSFLLPFLSCISFCACIGFFDAVANDGVFYAQGGQIIPISESEISVKKEVLSLKKEGDYLKVLVHYEFFNPGNQKTLLVGFEAPSPYVPESSYYIVPEQYYEGNPYISDFSVEVNGDYTSYDIAHVSDDLFRQRDYYKNGNIADLSYQQVKNMLEDDVYFMPYSYVYYFNATFKPGINVVFHTYKFKLSTSVDSYFNFSYILTAANRWANNGIDDFTLIVDMGNEMNYSMNENCFGSASEWQMKGSVSRCEYISSYIDIKLDEPQMILRKKNYHPTDELHISKFRVMGDYYGDIPGEYAWASMTICDDSQFWTYSKEELRLIRNEIYARHGYIFKAADLKKHFESQPWYIADPFFNPSTDLTEIESANIATIGRVEKLMGFVK
jgi:hypothetical protein